ncbi:cathepsin S [Xenopus laevis]|uniref:Cathepsin S n=2 Tax=Xenopus laevis TaxID=8355 RepID=A0A1L8F4H7_XENLA|nr:cathepsin S [Xenopus laevis]XP_018088927.1 cathepsin S [Xenopus laevis]XP_018088928.1 cathepsin S [Xenopus laevis]OCT66468.1 hypothetical protein XELAEV_18042718mg [Xenopus laevis]
MKTMCPATIFLVTLFSLLIPTHSAPDPTLDTHWQLWVKTHQKNYKDAEEERARRTIWEETLKFITVHNLEHSLGLHTYEVGMNHLGDMTMEEFTATMSGFQASDDPVPNVMYVSQEGVSPPEAIDWRKKNYVTEVMDQGDCQSCYAFSALGALEGQWKKKSGKLVSLSAQNLVDCSQNEGNNGCNRGTMVNSYEYIKHHGVNTNISYPYEGREGRCRFNANNVVARCSGYVAIPIGSEEKLKQAVGTIGPVAVAIDSNHLEFRQYKKGVYTNKKCDDTYLGQDHAVLVVGYGREDGEDYWLVKNSHGIDFGDKGYIKMRRNHHNHCGIANHASYPIFS